MDIDRQRIQDACKSFMVSKLYLIGSQARGDARPNSDVDLLVEFGPYESPLGQYIGVKNAFESIFNKKVDLVELEGIRNPFLKKSIEEDKVLLYEE